MFVGSLSALSFLGTLAGEARTTRDQARIGINGAPAQFQCARSAQPPHARSRLWPRTAHTSNRTEGFREKTRESSLAAPLRSGALATCEHHARRLNTRLVLAPQASRGRSHVRADRTRASSAPQASSSAHLPSSARRAAERTTQRGKEPCGARGLCALDCSRSSTRLHPCAAGFPRPSTRLHPCAACFSRPSTRRPWCVSVWARVYGCSGDTQAWIVPNNQECEPPSANNNKNALSYSDRIYFHVDVVAFRRLVLCLGQRAISRPAARLAAVSRLAAATHASRCCSALARARRSCC